MKKFISFFLFFIFCVSSFSEENDYYGQVNTKQYKINAVDKHIEEFEKEIKNLELLKKHISKNKFDINKKNSSPKIALVLSGGGAKGAGHVGVLKVLEKYNVPIDIIVGTSAGSIVGALYSIGYSPDEIEEFMLTQEFEKLFSNSPDRTLKNMSQKILEKDGTLGISIDDKNNIYFPLGIVNGEHIYLTFKKAFQRAENIKSFDDFPIKFRAIATNINTGKIYAAKDGDLAKSVLMSMAIPSVITPIDNNGQFYVDGGVVDNFPVIEAIRAGADIIIGVDISANPTQINDKSNIISVIDKVASYAGFKSTAFQKEYVDLLITPKVKDFGTLDFENLPKIIEEGSIAAEKFSRTLKNLSNENKFLAIKEKGKELKDFSSNIDHIELIGNKSITGSSVLDLKPKKDSLDIDDLNLWAKKLYALSYIDRVFYEVDDDKITFSIKESPRFKIYGNLNYISNDYGIALNLNTDLPFKNFLGQNYYINSEISFFPKIGFGNRSYYKFFGKDFTTNYTFSYEYNPMFLYGNEKGKLISKYIDKSFNIKYDLTSSLSDNLLFGVTGKYIYSKHSFNSGLPYPFEDDIVRDYLWGGTFILYDSLDSISFPTKGNFAYLIGFSNKGISSDSFDFQGYRFNFYNAFPINNKFSLGFFVNTAEIIENSYDYQYEGLFKVGGSKKFSLNEQELDFYGLHHYGIATNKVFITGLNLQYNLDSNLYLIGRYNVLTYDSDHLFFQKNSSFGDDFYDGYGVGLGWNTFLGPLELTITNNILDSNDILFNIYFGYSF